MQQYVLYYAVCSNMYYTMHSMQQYVLYYAQYAAICIILCTVCSNMCILSTSREDHATRCIYICTRHIYTSFKKPNDLSFYPQIGFYASISTECFGFHCLKCWQFELIKRAIFQSAFYEVNHFSSRQKLLHEN